MTDNAGEFESTMWTIVKDSKDATDYDAYLEIFPEGRYAAKARAVLRKLRTTPHTGPAEPTEPNPEHTKQQIDPRTIEAALQLTRKERTLIQQALNEKNHQAGTADGLFGQETRGAIWRYQSAMGLRKTGFLTGILAKELIEDGKRVEILSSPRTPDKNGNSSQTKDGFEFTFVSAVYDNGYTNFVFRVRNLSNKDKRIYYSGMSYTDNNGNICNRGNFLRQIDGISNKKKDGPTLIAAGEILQLTDVHVGCKSRNFSGAGSISFKLNSISEKGVSKRINFFISSVSGIKKT